MYGGKGSKLMEEKESSPSLIIDMDTEDAGVPDGKDRNEQPFEHASARLRPIIYTS